MRPATSADAYHARPDGTYLVGATWLHLCWSREVFATYLWGRPTVDDVRGLVVALRAEMTPHSAIHASHADVSRLEAVDPEAYAELATYLWSVRELSTSRIRAQSVVFGTGLAGSTAAGFFTAYEAPFPFRAFPRARDAASWLGVPPEAVAEWESLVARERDSDPALGALRDWLARCTRDATVAVAARALGLSARTLQRRLLERGTSFRREHDAARLALARSRLEARDEKLSSLARDLGFASHQHFTDWFRKLVGVTPSDYRAGARRGR